MKKTLSIIGNVLLWLFVAFSVVVTILSFTSQSNREGLPNIAGKALVTVQSDSMKPEFSQGDLIIVDILTNDEKKQCKEGDIITFYFDVNGDGQENEFNTHRIVRVFDDAGATMYETQGDNREMSTGRDKPINNSRVVGKYSGTHIPFLGSVIGFLQKPTGFLCVIVLPLVLFFLYELFRFVSLIIKMRTKSTVSAEQEDEIKKKAIEEYLRQQSEAHNSDGVIPNNAETNNAFEEAAKSGNGDNKDGEDVGK